MTELEQIDAVEKTIKEMLAQGERPREIARELIDVGFRYSPTKWRIDETYISWGRRVHNRLGARFDTKEDAEAYGRLIAMSRPGKDYQWCATRESF